MTRFSGLYGGSSSGFRAQPPASSANEELGSLQDVLSTLCPTLDHRPLAQLDKWLLWNQEQNPGIVLFGWAQQKMDQAT